MYLGVVSTSGGSAAAMNRILKNVDHLKKIKENAVYVVTLYICACVRACVCVCVCACKCNCSLYVPEVGVLACF